MKVELTMQSLGVEQSSCCDKQFDRGETMHAVVSDNGEPLGWWCADCLDNKTKKPPLRAVKERENDLLVV